MTITIRHKHLQQQWHSIKVLYKYFKFQSENIRHNQRRMHSEKKFELGIFLERKSMFNFICNIFPGKEKKLENLRQ